MSIEQELEYIVSSVTFEASSVEENSRVDELMDIVIEHKAVLKSIERKNLEVKADIKSMKKQLSIVEAGTADARVVLSKLKDDDAEVSQKLMESKKEVGDLQRKIEGANSERLIHEKLLRNHRQELLAYGITTG